MTQKRLTYIESVVLAGLVLLFATATYQRNIVWKDDLSLWSDIVKKSPNKARPYNNLGLALFNNKDFDKALVEFRQALRLNPRSEKAYLNIGMIYEEKGRIKDAIEQYQNDL
jgi:tetratricopeptide (TPR) repeat protein